MRVAVIGGVPQSLTTFRGALIKEIRDKGHTVYALAGGEESHITEKLASNNVEFVSYPIQRTRLNPFSDILTLLFLYRWYKKNKIDLVFSYTAKPVIWGGLACKAAGVPHFHAMITGLGRQFNRVTAKDRLISKLIVHLYKFALSNADSVIFQNQDDRQFFLDSRIIDEAVTHRVNGSGVDLDEYQNSPLPEGHLTFLTIGRLLAEKGFREFAAAANNISKSHPNAKFKIVGMQESGKNAITDHELKSWTAQSNIEFLGRTKNSIDCLNQCNVFVLATYLREGVPRTILEALAVGRPVITTDTVGCRDAITHGDNGLLVEPRNVQALTQAFITLIESPTLLTKMAKSARQRAEDYYDVKKVNKHMLRIMNL